MLRRLLKFLWKSYSSRDELYSLNDPFVFVLLTGANVFLGVVKSISVYQTTLSPSKCGINIYNNMKYNSRQNLITLQQSICGEQNVNDHAVGWYESIIARISLALEYNRLLSRDDHCHNSADEKECHRYEDSPTESTVSKINCTLTFNRENGLKCFDCFFALRQFASALNQNSFI